MVSDEAYEHLVFDGSAHVPFATLPGMAERTVTVGSAGKSLSMTGWKVGWATGPPDLVAAVRVARQHLSYVSSGPFQWAVAEGLALPDEYWRGFAGGLQAQRDQLCDGLAERRARRSRSRGDVLRDDGRRPLGYEDGVAFCRDLPARAGVVAIPHQAFHDDPGAESPTCAGRSASGPMRSRRPSPLCGAPSPDTGTSDPAAGCRVGQVEGEAGVVAVDVDLDHVAVADLAGEQRPGELVADLGLHQPAQRPRAVHRVVARRAPATRARRR